MSCIKVIPGFSPETSLHPVPRLAVKCQIPVKEVALWSMTSGQSGAEAEYRPGGWWGALCGRLEMGWGLRLQPPVEREGRPLPRAGAIFSRTIAVRRSTSD
jgi:hypothetical protein